MSEQPGPPAQSSQSHVSADGLFAFRADLGVWQPRGPVPPGTHTPDLLYQWTGTNWRSVYTLPRLSTQTRHRSATAVFAAVLGGLAACGLLVVVAFVVIGAFFAAVRPPCVSSKGC
jgi:hypothetical protein